MNRWLDVLQFFKRYGLLIYTGNRLDDLALAETELEDFYDMGLMERDDYLRALAIIRRERREVERSAKSTDI